MKMTSGAKRILTVVIATILTLTVITAVYAGSIPEKFKLSTGDASPYDIYAPRSIRDRKETERRAQKAAAEVPDVMLRSEQISRNVKTDVETFIGIISDLRANPPMPTPIATTTAETAAETTVETTAETTTVETTVETTTVETTVALPDPALLAEKILLEINKEFAIVMSNDDAMSFAILEDSRFNSIRGHITSLASLIMAETVDDAALKNLIATQIENLKKSLVFYQEDSGIIERALGMLLKPNVVFDQVATENARDAAYNLIQNNPVMIEKGSRIVSMGDIITDDVYLILQDLSLIDSGRFDYLHLAGIALLLAVISSVTIFYLRHHEKDNIRSAGDFASLMLALLIPLLASVYLSRNVPLSPPVYFAAVLISAYFGFRAAAILTLCLTITILPMTGFNPVFLVVAICGSLVAALFTKGVIRKDNYGLIILMTAGTNILITLSFGMLQLENWSTITLNCGYTALSGALSVIAAIGIMPLIEMLFNTVSPLRLIDLSQPGHPLLRRLFVEAPGSSQHSMMVANLADAAAVAIGANAMLARVGAYYHDIGKLENPMMFTENQEGENPHDFLTPEQSADIILSHPDAGVRIGRRYRLPMPILRMIHEHHGSTAQAYFYHKAMKSAEETQQTAPDPTRYKYRCPIPSTPESAIVMLADSVEAAMKSTGTTQIDEAEKLIRRLIKTKNEQDQLVESGLSFKDVETMVQAFLQVYSGHFHERVKYPDDRSIRQPAN